MKNNHINEERIIDYVLCKVSHEEQKVIAAHLQNCSYCQSLQKSWEGIFQGKRSEQPSSVLKERVFRSIIKNDRKEKNKKWPVTILTAIGTAALFFIIFQWLTQPIQLNHSPTIVQMDEQEKVLIMNDPMTKYVPIIPVTDFYEVSGNVWLNYSSDEMFVEIFQLPAVTNRDYQLWIIYENDQFTGELITTNNGTSRILFKNGDIEQLKKIKATIEPLGGSPIPTGPEPFIVDMKRGINNH